MLCNISIYFMYTYTLWLAHTSVTPYNIDVSLGMKSTNYFKKISNRFKLNVTQTYKTMYSQDIASYASCVSQLILSHSIVIFEKDLVLVSTYSSLFTMYNFFFNANAIPKSKRLPALFPSKYI